MFVRSIAKPLIAVVKKTTGIVGLDREVLIPLHTKTLGFTSLPPGKEEKLVMDAAKQMEKVEHKQTTKDLGAIFNQVRNGFPAFNDEKRGHSLVGLASVFKARVKKTTGIVGLDVVPNSKEVLISLCINILEEIKAVPKDDDYRIDVESRTVHCLSVCVEEDHHLMIERRLGRGSKVKKLIIEAQGELSLIRRMIAWDPWGIRNDPPLQEIEIDKAFEAVRTNLPLEDEEPKLEFPGKEKKLIMVEEEEDVALKKMIVMPREKQVLRPLTYAQPSWEDEEFISPGIEAKDYCNDWSRDGVLGPVRNQFSRATCWAYGATSSVEFLMYLVTGTLVPLSIHDVIRNRIDCGSRIGGNGEVCFVHGIRKGYVAEDDEECGVIFRIDGYGYVPRLDEEELKKAVRRQPIVVFVDGTAFDRYEEGIISSGVRNINHVVLIVGYGVTYEGTKYWLVKNSWGSDCFGKGYIRIQRGVKDKRGCCGIATYPMYPIVKSYNQKFEGYDSDFKVIP